MLKNIVVGVCSALVLVGCVAESDDVEVEDREAVIEEIVDNLVEAGYPQSEIEVREDGEVFVGGDAHVTLGASREMIGLTADEGAEGDENHFRHYRTNNLVGGGVSVICIDGSKYTGNTFSQGLDNAIANYNGLNLSFTMVRTNGSNAGCDAEIVGSIKGPTGGQSGFPSGGLPYGQFQVGKGTGNYGVGVVTHVVTHELGHTVGLRHSDYFNRAYSCGSGGNEGDGGVGAVHIQGTPVSYSPGSVMNSCFTANEDGNWNNDDGNALKALY